MTTLFSGADHFRRSNQAAQNPAKHAGTPSASILRATDPKSPASQGTIGDQVTLRFSGMTDSKSAPQSLATATPAKSSALQFGLLNNSTEVADIKKVTEIFLKDYQPPTHLIDTTDLTFDIKAGDNVVVSSKLKVHPNPKSTAPANTIRLHGAPEKAPPGADTPTMELLDVKVNGQPLPKEQYTREGEILTLKNLPEGEFTLEIQTGINPKANKSLAGLYLTKSGHLMTQCEAESFRNMTFYLDRPDVMSKFTTTIIADKGKYPQMLSNGNPGTRTERPDGREQITWTDPFKKPAYLFALVAGNLALIEDTYKIKSGKDKGKDVKIHLFVDYKDQDKARHAMKSIKQAMEWDESRFEFPYDLDLFMVVATDDFNMGAMENKGLNIFNTKYVLASPETATDSDYEHVQGVIGHEYFHNWTGNRITCRDWFQLSLKEGLTVFRDQEFTSDLNSRAVKRIDDVSIMRAAQFREDASPMAHPIRPGSYQEINNFYTLTVYNKGAEVIRMIHTLLGEKKFQEGMKLYFQRHDGQAVTTEDFVKAMADASGVDLSQFEKTWYNQAGTPTLAVTDDYSPENKEYRLTIKQSTPPSPGQPTKEPFHIPIRVGLMNPKTGQDMPLELADDQKHLLTNGDVLNLKAGETTFVFKNVPEKPIPSLLRNWSAPVKLGDFYTRDQLAFMMAHDSDGFNRWDAGQQLGIDVLKELVSAHQQGETKAVDTRLIDAARKTLDKALGEMKQGNRQNLALAAKALTLPSSGYLAELYPDGQVNVDAIYAAHKQARIAIGQTLEKELEACFKASRTSENRPYDWNGEDAGEREFKNTVLSYLVAAKPETYTPLAAAQFDLQHNMTDVLSALARITSHADEPTRKAKLDAFYQKHQADAGTIDKWFAVQAMADRPNALANVKALMQHDAYKQNADNPNRIRSLFSSFAVNTPHFHNKDGSGYEFLADQIINVDKFNPQVAARLTDSLITPHKYDANRRGLIKQQLERIRDNAQSPDVQEKVLKTLNALAEKEKQATKAAP
jgi:aminopeptidase N